MDVILKTFFVCNSISLSSDPSPPLPCLGQTVQLLLLGTDPFLLSASSLVFGISGTGYPTAFGRRHTASGDKQPVGVGGWQRCHAWEMLTGQMGGDRSVLRPETHSVDTSCLAPGGMALRAEPCKLGLKFNSM